MIRKTSYLMAAAAVALIAGASQAASLKLQLFTFLPAFDAEGQFDGTDGDIGEVKLKINTRKGKWRASTKGICTNECPSKLTFRNDPFINAGTNDFLDGVAGRTYVTTKSLVKVGKGPDLAAKFKGNASGNSTPGAVPF